MLLNSFYQLTYCSYVTMTSIYIYIYIIFFFFNFSFFLLQSENHEEWDASTLSKEEREARMKRKFDAIVKRERAMPYAYSHQVLYLLMLYYTFSDILTFIQSNTFSISIRFCNIPSSKNYENLIFKTFVKLSRSI